MIDAPQIGVCSGCEGVLRIGCPGTIVLRCPRCGVRLVRYRDAETQSEFLAIIGAEVARLETLNALEAKLLKARREGHTT